MISLLPRPRARRQGPSASMCLQVQARTCQRVAFPSLTRGCGFGAARRSGEGHGPGQCHWHLLKFTSTGISPGPSTTNLNPLPASDSSRGPDPARGPGRGGGPSSGAGVPVPSGSPPFGTGDSDVSGRSCSWCAGPGELRSAGLRRVRRRGVTLGPWGEHWGQSERCRRCWQGASCASDSALQS